MSDVDPGSVQVASRSHVGRVRATNQDSFGEFADGTAWRMLVLADGMGGHRSGEVASRVAVETIGEVVSASRDSPEQTLRKGFLAANERILEMASRDPQCAGMGTTGVALLIVPAGDAWVAHVGDSRAYVLREGKLIPLTADHSYVAELQRRGLITSEEAAVHPRRNEVLRSIGGEAVLEVDIRPVSTLPGDCFLLCTDGLWGVVPEPELVTTLEHEPPADAVYTLVELANRHGGPDNVTVQIARIPDGVTSVGARPPAKADDAVAARAFANRRRVIRRVAIAASILTGLFVAALLGAFLHFVSERSQNPSSAPTPQESKRPTNSSP
jgi:protein phosphatase